MSPLNFGLYLNNRGAVFIPDYSLDRLLDQAQEAEALGFHSVWAGDSLLAKPRYDPIIVLTAVAARTRTIKLGTGILQNHLRNPVLLALEWSALDTISHGRTIMGVGIGSGSPELMDKECDVAAVPRRRRGRILEEHIELLKLLWTEDAVTYHGAFYRLDGVSLGYRPRQRPHPPVWVAAGGYNPAEPGTGPFGYHVAAEAGRYRGPFDRVARLGDGWITTQATPDEYRATCTLIVRSAAEKYGRPDGSIHRAVSFWINVGPNRARARAEVKELLEGYNRLPFDDATLERFAIYGTPDDCIRRLRDFEASGAQTMLLMPGARDQTEQMRTIAREIMPAFRAG
jgi:alkanesulfonate monooxygenase SsuD/methylene tetrahydromethanopterin reductase-like flavin-dependent oxidoreductase (luciferase family)